ncbi:alpha/beta hydrolase [Paraburkholderia acidisoli]|uniref:Alpha/beta hydrolase fold domain-containing protein n=1 Tax=Paraburkholderia acidisoli TaxID=2571748 RepID=A0A7Z2GGQ5_9BURK|nr:alpha/beta hydrolase [Paraburkholderia acidisoli]QGZ61497.1 alpha/beta hydrolase fold domain-containing protein [Paraburkholderia acidisoli]
MPLTAKMALVLEMVARGGRPPYHEQTPQDARAWYEKSASVLEIDAAPLHGVDDLRVPVRDGTTIRARLYRPVEPQWSEPLPVLVYYHGGGFTTGSVDTHDALCRMFARDARCAVLSVDYRLAPEHRFPTAVHDAFDAYAWLHAQAAGYALDATRIAVGGDSAGGTLAAVVAVLARDAGIAPVLQLLFYPAVAARQQSESHERLAEGYLLTARTIQWFFRHYARSDADRDDWRFAPLDGTQSPDGRVPGFRDLAPAWIGVAEFDPFVDEGEAYARKLRAAGNAVTLVRYAGVIHEFIKMGSFVDEAREAHRDAAQALRAAFGTGD